MLRHRSLLSRSISYYPLTNCCCREGMTKENGQHISASEHSFDFHLPGRSLEPLIIGELFYAREHRESRRNS